ncbi:MAG: ATP-binding cassette domain-containing protein [Bacteroidales bacterium]|nr:ATP-binding cassette domain-containing protein [Bacteroidales bacterium]
MKRFFSLFRYLIPYKLEVVLNLTCNVLGAVFSLFTLTMLIPFLQLLFGTAPMLEVKPDFELTVSGITDAFYYFVSSVIRESGHSKALLYVVGLVMVASLLKNLFTYLALYYLAPIRTGVVRDIRNDLYDKVLDLPLGYYSEERKGDIISKMSNDVTEVEVSVIRSLEMLFKDPVLIIVHFVGLLFISARLTLFVLIILPITGAIIGKIGKTLRRTSFEGQQRLGDLLALIEETLGGLRIVKAFNAEHSVAQHFRADNERYTKLITGMEQRRNLASPLSEFMGTAVVALVLWFGSRLIFSGSDAVGPEALIAFIGIFYMIINPAKSFASAYFNILKGMASADRIESILREENPIKIKSGAHQITELRDRIEIRNVSFRYDERYVLRDINLTIAKGQTVALVGQSGAGKSTLVDLIPRFWDVSEGEILIDGVNIKDCDLRSLRALMGNVSQESILFNDTFYNNIAFGVQSNEQRVREAAKVANAHQFIEATPEGYSTNIGDRGGKLSGGQRQRISIARAVLRNPPIMILDEATSALDTESEQLVQQALDNLMQHRTVIVIAHRLSTIKNADLICVMHEGRIVERGRHNELIALNGHYTKLHSMQAL